MKPLFKFLVIVFLAIVIHGLVFCFFYFFVSKMIYLILKEIASETEEYLACQKYLTKDQKILLSFEYFLLYQFLPYFFFIIGLWLLIVLLEHLEFFFLKNGEAFYHDLDNLSLPKGYVCFCVFILRSLLFLVIYFLS
jgi:hypothetical protein